MSQKDVIRKHLVSYGSITSWEAIQHYRVTRLAAVISLLKKDGLEIDSTPQFEEGDGTKTGRHYTKYVLRERS